MCRVYSKYAHFFPNAEKLVERSSVYSTQTQTNIKQLQVDWYELSISCPGDENKFSFTSNSSFRKNISFFPENNPRLPRVIEVKIICSISRILTTIKMGQQKGIIRKCVCV